MAGGDVTQMRPKVKFGWSKFQPGVGFIFLYYNVTMGNIIHVLVEVTATTLPRKFAKALVTLAGILCQINARSKHTSRRAACPFHAKEVSGYALSRFWICAVKQIVLIDLLSSATTCTNTASS